MAKSVEFRFYARMQELLRGMAQGKAGMGELQQESRQFAMSADEVRAKMKLLNTEIGGLKDVSAIQEKQEELKRLGAQLDDINGKQAKASGGAGMSVGKGAFLGSLAGGLGASALSALPGLIGGIGSAMISGNAEIEKYEIQFGTLMGSADAAKERLKELAKFGAETPFELPEIAAAEKVLLGFGLTGQKVIDLTGKNAEGFRTLVGDIAAGTGASFEEIALNMGKLSSGATGEAISRFQEMGIATREQLTAMGVEFSKSGELLSPLPVAMQAITKLTEDKFGGGMKNLSASASGLSSTLSDTFGEMARTIGKPFFDNAKGGLIGVLDFLGSPGVKLGIEKLADSISDMLGVFDSEAQALTRANDRARELNGKMMDLTKTQIDAAQKTLTLGAEYTALAEKSTRTADEQERMDSVIQQLRGQYPGLIKSTTDYAGAIDDVSEAMAQAQEKFDRYNLALKEQQRRQLELAKTEARLNIMRLREEVQGMQGDVGMLLGKSSEVLKAAAQGGPFADVRMAVAQVKDLFNDSAEEAERFQMLLTKGDAKALDTVRRRTDALMEQAIAEGNRDKAAAASQLLGYIQAQDNLALQEANLEATLAQIEANAQLEQQGEGGTGTPPPKPPADDKKAKEAFDKAMAELARQEAIDEQKAKNAHATEQTLFDIWVGYQERRIAAAEKYGQERADLENELAVKRLEREGEVERERAERARWVADVRAKAAERERAEEEKKTKKLLDELDKQAEAVSKSVKNAEERERDRTKLEQEESRMRSEAGMQALENVQAAAGEGNAVFKAAAIARTGISTYEAATSAYSALAGIPLVGPALGIAAAAAAIAAGLANVGKITGIKLAAGGVLDRPTFALAGEAGPELVAPMMAVPGMIASALRLALRPETRRTRISEKQGTRISVGISSRVVGRGSRASQISSTVGVF